MSVSFWCPSEERKLVGSTECLCVDFHSQYSRSIGPDECCPYCGGTGYIKQYARDHEFNLTNSNAAAVLNAIDLPHNLVIGEIQPNQFPDLRKKLNNLLDKEYGNCYCSDTTNQIGIDVSNESMKRRFSKLLNLIDYAQMNNDVIVWG
jgi:hypothetical protein